MKKIKSALGFLIRTTSLEAQTTFRLELIAEGNYGTPNGDIFARNTTVSPATTHMGTSQSVNGTTGFDVLQHDIIAENQSILTKKLTGAGRNGFVG